MFDNGSCVALSDSLETIGAACAILGFDGSWILISANSRFSDICMKPVPECIGVSTGRFLPAYIETPLSGVLTQCVTESRSLESELVIERETASRWWRVIAAPILGTDALCSRALITMIEITDKKNLEAQLASSRQRFEAVVKTAYDGIITIDEQQNIRMMNNTARTLFGVGQQQVEGSKLSRFIPARYRDSHQMFVSAFRGASIDARPMHARAPVVGLRADGTEFPIEVTISKITVNNGTEMTAVIRDISERTRLVENLRIASSHDPLTGLFNRRYGNEILAREAVRSSRFGHVFSVALLDIDHFSEVNDRLGYYGGDMVLSAISKLLAASVREIDTVCRWGGEQFLFLFPETSSEEAFRWAERIRLTVAEHVFSAPGNGSLSLTVSVGISTVRKDPSVDPVIVRADRALRESKQRGRNTVSVGEN